jgi:tryptophan 2,3-dioxygenase
MTVKFSETDLKQAMVEWLIKHQPEVATVVGKKVASGDSKDLYVSFDTGIDGIEIKLDYTQ